MQYDSDPKTRQGKTTNFKNMSIFFIENSQKILFLGKKEPEP